MSTFPAELTGDYDIDPAHSTIGFTVKHAMVSTTRGHFDSFSGGATLDAASPEKSTAWVDIEATSVNTGQSQRDGHLQSPDFWDANQYPKITFRSTSAKLDGDDLVMTGDLSIKGNSRPVEIRWEFGGMATDPFGATKAGFEGTATINRSDWDLTYNAALETGGFLISDKVKLVLDIEASKKS